MILRETNFICPFCNNEFTNTIAISFHTAGTNLDLKPVEFMPVPDFLQRCPKCGFYFLRGLFSEDDIVKIKTMNMADSIYSKEPNMPRYYYLARICELLNKDEDRILYFYHSAIWKDLLFFDVISEIMLNYFERTKPSDKNYYKYKIIKLDFLRRKGEFEKAGDLIKELEKDEQFSSEKNHKTLLEYQQELIDKKDTEEHRWPLNKEDIERKRLFLNFIETTTISVFIKDTSVTRELLDTINKITSLNRSFIYQKANKKLPIMESSIDFRNYPYSEVYGIICRLKKSGVNLELMFNYNNNIKKIELMNIDDSLLSWSETFQEYIFEMFI